MMMNLYTLKIIILNILLFNSNVVYCNETGKKSSNPFEVKTNDNTTNNKINRNNIERFSPNLTFNCGNYQEVITLKFLYEIANSQRAKLSHPNTIDRIVVPGYTFHFDENAKLPNVNVDHITIYTCIHNSPILMHMHGDSRFYYYSFNPKTNRWTNHRIQYDTTVYELVDLNAIYFYREIPTDFHPETFKYEDKELVKRLCIHGKHNTNFTIEKHNNIDVYIKRFNISNSSNNQIKQPQFVPVTNKTNVFASGPIANNSFVYNNVNETPASPLTNVLDYKVKPSFSSKLVYPNRLDRINFNNYMIAFDNNTILPETNVDHITIYTCRHNNPLLLYMWADSSRYYYSPNSKTNKWSNYKIQYDTTMYEFVDSNGVYYYKISPEGSPFGVYKYEDEEIARRICNDGKCPRLNANKNRDIDFIFKTSNIPTISNNQPLNKNQQNTIANGNKAVATSTVKGSVPQTNHLPTKLFFYKLEEPIKSKLVSPNRVDKINFNDYMIQFDNNTILPIISPEIIYIYTCIHNKPILMYMYDNSRFYYYSLNPKTNKWTNHRIQYHTGLNEYIDANGIYFYKISFDFPPTTTFKFEDIELAKHVCSDNKCPLVNANRDREIDIYVKERGNSQAIRYQSSSKTQFVPTFNVTRNVPSNTGNKSMTNSFTQINDLMPTNLFFYKINNSIRERLLYPTKVERINFNGYMIQFDDNAAMPSLYVDFIYVYTCKHNTPILIYMQCKLANYYYSIDPKSNKWNNHRIQYGSGLKEYKDRNGTFYYILSAIDANPATVKFEDKELVKHVCKENKCQKVNVDINRNIQVFLKNSNTPKFSNVIPKTQLNTKPSGINTAPNTSNGSHENCELVPSNIFFYKIEDPLRESLIYPNKMIKINFNGYMIQFDENAKLPSVKIDNIFIYTCEHNNPMLLLLLGNLKFYYYSFNPKTNKWNNHLVKYDTRFKNRIDSNGAFFSTIYDDNTYKSDEYEDEELIRTYCKDGKCRKINLNQTRSIDVYITKKKQPHILIYQASSKYEHISNSAGNNKSTSTFNRQSRNGDDTGSNNGYEQDTYESDIY